MKLLILVLAVAVIAMETSSGHYAPGPNRFYHQPAYLKYHRHPIANYHNTRPQLFTPHHAKFPHYTPNGRPNTINIYQSRPRSFFIEKNVEDEYKDDITTRSSGSLRYLYCKNCHA